jgi:protein phosphatase PTC2/3
VEKYLKEAPDEIEEALSTGFVNSNTALMTTPIKYMSSGSTCVCLYIRGSTYYVANCGDSRAVLARAEERQTQGAGEAGAGAVAVEEGALKAIDLSRDHKPDDPIELERITSWGGFVSPAPEPGLSARVWLDPEYTMIGLAMGRSIGSSPSSLHPSSPPLLLSLVSCVR